MARVAKSDRRLFKQPFVFPSQLFTTGNGQEINGGAAGAGDSPEFPSNAFLNALSRPVMIERIKFSVTRTQGGNEIDSDYDNIAANIQDLVTNEFYMKDPVPLSALCDKQRREWLLHPGLIMLRALGGGLRVRMTVLPGAIGAPYNVTIGVHGYTEMFAETPEAFLPEER